VLPSENFFEIFDAKSRVWGQYGPENKLIEGQPNEYDVIRRNVSVLAFHLWPTYLPERHSGTKLFARTAFHHVPAPLHRCFSVQSQEIGCEECVQNVQFGVGSNVRL